MTPGASSIFLIHFSEERRRMLQNRKGFTLIELLIVVVIIGILAAIAIPKFSATREKAYFSAMKADLRNLQTQQEIFYSGVDVATKEVRYKYAADATDADLAFAESQGVEVEITKGDENGWTATAKHKSFGAEKDTRFCAVFVGDGYDLAPADVAGVVTCTGEK
jgi:prepilin-type N-terminal cleavage/methylation domain-containing protein